MQLRKIIKTRGHFPSDEAATKLIWLAVRNVMKNWSRGAREWIRKTIEIDRKRSYASA
jgi:transposase-like protein